jgi:hypothetical protein
MTIDFMVEMYEYKAEGSSLQRFVARAARRQPEHPYSARSFSFTSLYSERISASVVW